MGGATVFHSAATTTTATTALALFFVFSHLEYNKSDYNCKDKKHRNCTNILSDKFHNLTLFL